jgi:hypothetical protein
MGYVSLSTDQFTTLEQACVNEAKNPHGKIKSITTTSSNTGVIVTPNVTVDYTYDPLKQVLNFNIGQKHSLAAHIAGDNVITNHLVSVLHNLEFPSAPQKKSSGIDGDAGDWTAKGDGTAYPVEPVVTTPVVPINADLNPPVA